MRTSTFISDCLKAYPAMRNQVLLFKWIMSVWGLNKTFTGIDKLTEAGLSSYCISLMVLAYLQLKKIVTHDNPGDLFIQLLKFYGKEFNPKLQGIWPNLLQW